MLRSLKDIANNLQESGILENDLIETIDSAKWIRETNSLMFVGSPESNIKIKELVTSLDVGGRGRRRKASFFVYQATEPQRRRDPEIDAGDWRTISPRHKAPMTHLIATIRSQKTNPADPYDPLFRRSGHFSQNQGSSAYHRHAIGKGVKAPSRQNFLFISCNPLRRNISQTR